jgi:DNA-binding GntR family transcriptional regulator
MDLVLTSPAVPRGELTKKRADPRALVDELAARIQARILNGEVAVGARLRQETLAAEFGVSRTPVREALRKLQASGILEVEPHRGAVVRAPNARDIRDAYEVRAELEGAAAEFAATRMRDDQLVALHDAQQLFQNFIAFVIASTRARDGGEADGDWVRANDDFHLVILQGAGNTRLLTVVQDLHRTFPRSLTWAALRANSALLEQNVEEHNEIVDALDCRDPGAARRRMVAHVLHAGELVARHFEQSRFE